MSFEHSIICERSAMAADKTVIGTTNRFWLFDKRHGFDLTHPDSPSGPTVYPRMTIQTSRSPVTIAPQKSAIVIIDMQNYFLSPAMRAQKDGSGYKAHELVLSKCIPAARKAKIPVIWLNWGLSENGLLDLPPLFYRGFGYTFTSQEQSAGSAGHKQEWHADEEQVGKPIGKLKLEDGSIVEGGRLLMRDQWNTQLYGRLADAYHEGLTLTPPDQWVHKETHSGFWGPNSDLANHLRNQGITTLLFGGVNTDQCVGGTLQDAAQQGFDTIMLKDVCGTPSPDFAQQMIEFNAEKAWGFLSTCEDLLLAAAHVEEGPDASRNALEPTPCESRRDFMV